MKDYDSKFLSLLSDKFQNIQSATTEIINLEAILQLPKGTEHFMSDLHGEYDAFTHILNNASGVIKDKINLLFKDIMTEDEQNIFATIIYYPEEKIKEIKSNLKRKEIFIWYQKTLIDMIKVLRLVSTKYSRSKVRKFFPTDFEYIIEELITINNEIFNKEEYYSKIINTIIELDRAESFIIALSTVIKKLTVDTLHIVGDIYDRGNGPHIILDKLIKHHSVDVQWGNHDVLWMGAISGSMVNIMGLLYIASKYNNLSVLEDGYGINLRHLSNFADKTYSVSECFKPKISEECEISKINYDLICKINKCVAVLLFKLEGQLIMRNKSFEMEERLLLDKMDFDNETIKIKEKTYNLLDIDFPTFNLKSPYDLTEEEFSIIQQLKKAFTTCKYLKKHIKFLYNKGSLYKVCNNNLLYHGCIPMNKDGSYTEFEILDKKVKGKDLFDTADFSIRQAYFLEEESENKQYYLDLMWYWWCGKNSPFFGKDKMTTFERVLINEEESTKEPLNCYYKFILDEDTCNKILSQFGVENKKGHIINGHLPVRLIKGEEPIKANGKLIVIDGGFSKVYHKQTGTAGYTLIYNSYDMRISTHKPFDSVEKAIKENMDIYSSTQIVDTMNKRVRIIDTDMGKEILSQIDDLKLLLNKYKSGEIRQKDLK
ncbi:MAG: fructose-1,6-bisphosphatase [Oscillospiraceae bacterium]